MWCSRDQPFSCDNIYRLLLFSGVVPVLEVVHSGVGEDSSHLGQETVVVGDMHPEMDVDRHLRQEEDSSWGDLDPELELAFMQDF